MKIGDLVRCKTANDTLAVIVAVRPTYRGQKLIEVVLNRSNTKHFFQWQQLELVK